ncbi:MAG: tetraacyldisaccharide 4'-kinase [Chelatococcus sp.]|nr:MAG: tetraacyldisaccharide 4'-kinase [Chelatococcus sp.]
MRAPGFWWLPEPGPLARLLQPLGVLYGAATLARMRRPGLAIGVPVICVGNFVAGGAGKTPTALALCALLAGRGETPFILSRGYGGRLAGPVEVDPAGHGAADVGDEPLLMARSARTIVARDRPAGAALARSLGASVIVMDDGLQNPSLAKSLRLAVVDGAGGAGNGLCLPAGPLRAPLAGQFGLTDAVILIGEGVAGEAVAAAARRRDLPVLTARLEPPAPVRAALRGRRVVAASGIGRPEKFSATLRDAGAEIVAERVFADHHAYSAGDVTALLAEARAGDCVIATTEKDATKLAPLWPESEAARLLVVPVALSFAQPERIARLLGSVADARSGTAAAPQP